MGNDLVRRTNEANKVQPVVVKRRLHPGHAHIRGYIAKKYGESVFNRKYELGQIIDYKA